MISEYMVENRLVLCLLCVSVLTFLLVFQLGMTEIFVGKQEGEGYRNPVQRMFERSRNLLWYEKNLQWMQRNGAAFHFGEWLNPVTFLLLRIAAGLAGLAVFTPFSVLYGILAAGMLFFLPAGLVLYMNSQDNLKMLPELKHLYHSLEIQTRAGVYVTDALAEVYGSVSEKRLKKALLDLAGDIVMRSDFGEALEKFQSKFDNRYVDSLCIILLQAMESGQAVDLLSDLSEQIKDMEVAVMSRKKEALDRSVTFYQLGILVAIMGIVLYACVTQMFSAAAGF